MKKTHGLFLFTSILLGLLLASTLSGMQTVSAALPAPTRISPLDGSTIIIPTFSWQADFDAAKFTTYNFSVTPFDTTDAPVLVSPGDNEAISLPTMVWMAVDGAAYYKVELSVNNTFVPVFATYTTYNLQITPVDVIANNTYYWRVSGVDADDHVGNNNWRKFTLISPPAATDIIPLLETPAHGQTISTDPNFSWTRMIGAHDYNLIVSKESDFSSTYDTVLTHYNSYTPTIAESPEAYPNGIYYWKVEARNAGGTVIGTSSNRSFSKGIYLYLPIILK